MGYEKPESRTKRNERRREMKPALMAKMHNGEFPRTKLKKCRDCGELKECDWLGSFSMSGEPEYRARCPECYKKYVSALKKKRRASTMYKRGLSRDLHKKEALEYLGGKCVKCGESDPDVLTFHHKDPNNKLFDVGARLNDGTRADNPKILEELKKCEIMCFNCHMKFHIEETRKRQKDRYERNDNTKIERTRKPLYKSNGTRRRDDNPDNKHD